MALNFCGEKTINELNELSGIASDSVFRVLDSGILADSIYCKPGTFVEWSGSAWSVSNVSYATTIDITDLESRLGIVKNGGALTDAASVNVPNNSLSTLTTSQASLTLNVACAENEVPNFAVEITAGVAVTLTVTKTVGSTTTTLKHAEAAGNTLESGKFYQVTCVGSCWTLAEFGTANA